MVVDLGKVSSDPVAVIVGHKDQRTVGMIDWVGTSRCPTELEVVAVEVVVAAVVAFVVVHTFDMDMVGLVIHCCFGLSDNFLEEVVDFGSDLD